MLKKLVISAGLVMGSVAPAYAAFEDNAVFGETTKSKKQRPDRAESNALSITAVALSGAALAAVGLLGAGLYSAHKAHKKAQAVLADKAAKAAAKAGSFSSKVAKFFKPSKELTALVAKHGPQAAVYTMVAAAGLGVVALTYGGFYYVLPAVGTVAATLYNTTNATLSNLTNVTASNVSDLANATVLASEVASASPSVLPEVVQLAAHVTDAVVVAQ